MTKAKSKGGRKRRQLTLPHVPDGVAKKEGQPLVAFRVEARTFSKFVTKHGTPKKAWDVLRSAMVRAVRR